MILVLRHVPHEGLGTLAPAFDRAGLPYRYLDVWKRGARFPSPGALRALVIMGGPMGVYEKEKYSFLKMELRFIKKCLAARKPVLGICLGAQLVAHALGAAVYPNRKKEIGWYPLELTAEGRRDALFRSFPRRPTVFQWHGDTFDLPRGAVHLARSFLCRHQAFRFRDAVYGLQFHVEVDGAMVRDWLRQPGSRRELAAVGPRAWEKAASGINVHMPGLSRLAGPFFQKFVKLARPRGF
jgi:GMP synthase (glutamine-hydrolysing)